MKLLIQNILAVLPENAETSRASACDVYIDGSCIAAIDVCPEGFQPEYTMDGTNKLMIPGLINTHAHTYMTMLRNCADDLPFSTWLFERIMPLEEKMTQEDAYWSAMLACAEMISGGITCFSDMHMFPENSVRAALDSGMRAVIARGLSGSCDIPGGARRLKEAVDEYTACKGRSDRLSFMLAPHAITTCDAGYLREIAACAKSLGLGIHTHLSEGRDEAGLCAKKYGCTPAELYHQCGLWNENSVAAHAIYLSDSDMELLAHCGVSVSLNPASNLKLSNGIAPVPQMLEKGINCALGTDSTASNNSLSILREMSLTSLLHKGISGNPLAATAQEVFHMATKNGAKALGLHHKVGTIAQGMRADLSIFSLNTPELTPVGDPVSALCYAAGGCKAETVIIDGVLVLHNGQYQTLDIDRILYEVNTRMQRLMKA